jgi:hypothetical protein
VAEPDFILEIDSIAFRAIEHPPRRFQARDFNDALGPKQMRHFLVAARVLATTLGSGRPPAWRVSRVRGSKLGLYELRITPLGTAGAHARLLYVCEAPTIWCARGLLKRERLQRKDIELAERAISAWRERKQE